MDDQQYNDNVDVEMHDLNDDYDPAGFEEHAENSIKRLTVRTENAKNVPSWGRKTTIIRLHPSISHHLNHLKNVTITKSFFGEKLPIGWIKRAAEKKVKFNLKRLRLISCDITFDELDEICEDSKLEKVYIHKCSASPSISMKDIASWLKYARKILIDLKGIKFDPDWLKYLMERGIADDGDEDSKIESLMIRNIPLKKMNELNFDAFLKTVSYGMNNVVTLSFKEPQLIATVIDKRFSKLFQRVSKKEFAYFYSTEKFIVHYQNAKRTVNFYYVSIAAYEETEQLGFDFKSLRVKN
uniref:DUF38 domain-containing protein n=1 Tax=Panagrolaimus sp. ES5 TaxID=591445 RepID=A0AC34F5U7_9BILA